PSLANLSGHPASILHGLKNGDWFWAIGGSFGILFFGAGVGLAMVQFGALSAVVYWPLVAIASLLWLFCVVKGVNYATAQGFPPPGYIRWLEQRSMLHRAAQLSREVSGSAVLDQFPHSTPNPQGLLANNSVWYTASPPATMTQGGEHFLPAM